MNVEIDSTASLANIKGFDNPAPEIVRAQTFREWSDAIRNSGSLPLLVITGSKGKSTIAHLIHTMAGTGIRSALRTDQGVWIENRQQDGEIGPWSEALAQLASGKLDLAIWEVDWPAAQIMRHTQRIAGLIVTNLCSNRPACLESCDLMGTKNAINRLAAAVSPAGFHLINSDDYSLADFSNPTSAEVIRTGAGLDSPVMRRHVASGRRAAWIDNRTMYFGEIGQRFEVSSVNDIGLTFNGAATFQAQNAMMAVAASEVMGIRTSKIANVLRTFTNGITELPGSFNSTVIGGVAVIVDRPDQPWFMLPAVRALREMRKGRVITVCAQLPVPLRSNASAIGRMLAKASTAIFAVTGRATDGYDWEPIKSGASQVEYPPLVVPYATVSSAVKKALAIAKPLDSIFVVTDHPERLAYLWR